MPAPDPRRPALCLSDLHLTDPQSAAFATMAKVLRHAAAEGANLFLLGDICEVWVGDDDDGPLAGAFRALLSELSGQTWVGLMHGNRDFLFGKQLAADTGAMLLPDPYRFGDHVLLSHGDQYCVDDVAYQQVRTLFRSEEWQASVMAQTLTERRALAANLRNQSASANANKASNIMDVNADAIRTAMQAAGCQLMIHGHTHRPAWHQTPDFDRVVLGDWDRCAWVVRLAAGASMASTPVTALRQRVQLECLPQTGDSGH